MSDTPKKNTNFQITGDMIHTWSEDAFPDGGFCTTDIKYHNNLGLPPELTRPMTDEEHRFHLALHGCKLDEDGTEEK